MIKLKGIGKKYEDRQVLENVNADIRDGELFGIIGHNGSGKSTLLNILSTLVIPDCGSLTYSIKDKRIGVFDGIKNPQKVRMITNMVFQEPTMDEDQSVLENLEINALLYIDENIDFKRRSEELIRRFDLMSHKLTPIKKLSGGLKKRAEIARGLLNNPHILLLDEPTLGLDPLAKKNVWKYIRELRKSDTYRIIIVSTNDMQEARLCDRCLLLKNGMVAKIITKKSFKGVKHFI